MSITEIFLRGPVTEDEMSAGVDDGTCLPYLLGSGGRLWWHRGGLYTWVVPFKPRGEIIIHVFLHNYVSEIEWRENDYEALVYDDPGRILMKDDFVTGDFCI